MDKLEARNNNRTCELPDFEKIKHDSMRERGSLEFKEWQDLKIKREDAFHKCKDVARRLGITDEELEAIIFYISTKD